MKILILEDNRDRQSAMSDCLRDRFYQYDHVFFDDAAEMCAYLKSHLADSLVISLDHDLDLKPTKNGNLHDPGTGRVVADFLADRQPNCPIVVATTNSAAGDGMEFLLRESGWEVSRVHPFGDTEWIAASWFRAIRDAVVRSSRKPVNAARD